MVFMAGCLFNLLLVTSGWMSSAQADNSEPECIRSNFRIALDAGHWPNQAGATSARGKTEASFNLRLVNESLTGLKEAGFKNTFHVNSDGQKITLKGRTERAEKLNADLFVSIHHDSVQEHYLETWEHEGTQHRFFDGFAGYSLFINSTSKYGSESKRFGESLGRSLLRQGLSPTLHHAEKIAGENRQLLNPALGLYRFDGLAVLRTAQSPALLFEAGVMMNRAEEARLDRTDHRAKIVAALVQAVDDLCRASY
jgi:N-acetylmuramoyl-L-alanine amidase